MLAFLMLFSMLSSFWCPRFRSYDIRCYRQLTKFCADVISSRWIGQFRIWLSIETGRAHQMRDVRESMPQFNETLHTCKFLVFQRKLTITYTSQFNTNNDCDYFNFTSCTAVNYKSTQLNFPLHMYCRIWKTARLNEEIHFRICLQYDPNW